jgi:chemotaxis protein MotB
MARRSGRRRRARHDEGHGGADERWLLTYSDLITLLMALFVIFFAMSSLDAGKFTQLKVSLSDAFSGKVLDGGSSVLANGGTGGAVSPLTPTQAEARAVAANAAAKRETDDLQALKRRIDAYAAAHHLQAKIDTRIERRGLIVDVLTDRLLFGSASATLRREGERLMTSIGTMLRGEGNHDVLVEGYTDDVPISSAAFPTNWELSTARASTVVRTFLHAHVAPQRLTAAGRAYLDPVASNRTASGRARNRRVQIVIPRRTSTATAGDPGTQPSVDIPDIDVGVQEIP